MSFDLTLHPMAINIVSPDPENLEPGQPPVVELVITVGMMLPFQTGPGQPPPVAPLGNVHFPLQPSTAKQVGEKLSEEGARFPDRPNIDIASSLEGIDRAAKFERDIRGD